MSNPSFNIRLNSKVREIFRTESPHAHFFGYYYESPLDRGGKHLLAHRTSFDNRGITAMDSAEIGYYEINSGKWRMLGITRAFNWQQGARLQWLPPDYSSHVIYNDRTEKEYVSVIIDIATGERKIIPFPIYAVHQSGEFALGVNYERLYFCRPGYNYQGIVRPEWNQPVSKRDGIFHVNLKTGKVKLLISTKEIVETGGLPAKTAKFNHWLEHVVWNPTGTRFAFLHRWDSPPDSHTTRLFTANADGSYLFLYPPNGFYSHMGWRTEDEFTIWTFKDKPKIQRSASSPNGIAPLLYRTARLSYRWIRDRVLPTKMMDQLTKMTGMEAAFVHMQDQSGPIEILGKDLLNRNGHNSWSPVNNQIMLTDTYDDQKGFRHLLLFYKDSGEVVELGKFFSPFNISGYRCDLHPRWSRDGTQVIVDSAHEGQRRQMYVYAIDEFV